MPGFSVNAINSIVRERSIEELLSEISLQINDFYHLALSNPAGTFHKIPFQSNLYFVPMEQPPLRHYDPHSGRSLLRHFFIRSNNYISIVILEFRPNHIN